MLDVYAYLSGAERLKRLEVDVAYGVRDPGKDPRHTVPDPRLD